MNDTIQNILKTKKLSKKEKKELLKQTRKPPLPSPKKHKSFKDKKYAAERKMRALHDYDE